MKSIMSSTALFVSGAFVGYFFGPVLVPLLGTFFASTVSHQASTSTVSGGVPTPSVVSTGTSATAKSVLPLVTKPVTVSPTKLTDAQKTLLSAVGIDPNKFVVTPKMIQCAEVALGAPRLSEIIAGSKPSALEILKVTPCL